MSKKHFEYAAHVVREGMRHNTEVERRIVAANYARLFEEFSATFDRARFYTACGLEAA
jgi:hypothetical protein